MVITKEEVEQHNKNEDAWIIFNEGVYDITKWHKSHPGGTVILHYKGQDATEPIQAFHPDIVKVQKIMEIFKVGELAEKDRVTKENPKTKLTAEFRELRADFIKEGLITTDKKMSFYLPHLLQVVFLEVLAVLAYTWTNSLFLTAFILSVAQIQAGWLQHDYGHNSVYDNLPMNQFYHYLTIGVLKGALSEWWKSRHNRHHSKTNTILLDPDIHTEPLFSFSEELVQTKNAKLKHAKRFVKFLEYQHYYWFLFGPPMVTTLLFLLENAVFVVTKASFFDILSVFLYFVRFDLTFRCYLSIDPLKVIFLYFLMRFMESHWFTWITSMNHLPRPKSRETPSDWVTLQLTATQNTTNGFWFDWSTGHLNYQIEHHLFPEMPRHNYPLVAKRVRELCERNGVEYRVASLWQSTKEIVLKLRDVATIYSNKIKRV